MSGTPFMSEDQVKANITLRELFLRLWPYCRKHLKLCLAVILSVAGLAITSRILPYLIGYAIDHGVQEKNLQILKSVAWIYLAVQILQTLFQFSYNYIFQLFGNRVLFYVREDLVRHIQSLPIQYFNKTPVGRIVTRLTNDVANLAELFTEGVITILVEFVMLSSILVAMSLISWKLTLASMGLAPFFIWASLKINRRLREVLREAKKKLSTLNSFVAENLNGIKVIQLYNRVSRNRNHFFALSDQYKNLTLGSIRAYALMQPVMNLFSAVTISSALYFGGYFHQESGLAIGALVTFILHVQDFIPPLREILDKYQQFQNSLTSGERVFHVFDETPEIQKETITRPSQWNGEIEIRSLSFQYASHLPPVLKDINLKIAAGQSVALVGRTGSGKSTFISLLQRFYEPPENSIWIDGLPIERIPFSLLRKHIGVVQQDNFVFRGTIASNITLNSEGISLEKVEKACRQVGYWDLLQQSGRNLHSPVEERGANLSVGERQLIAFARILAFEPDILILDEATANIDSQSEKIIQQATAEVSKGRTSLIIAHRLSTIQNCDLIVVLDQGEIKEFGNHSELMARHGMYHQLASAGVKSTEI
ncbi:MAG: ABC transporter ATP-binding protein [Pseudobdellovibrionaceae bacterium]